MNESDYHASHCDLCYKSTCRSRGTCPVVDCDYGCGKKFHQCKQIEHMDFCPKSTVKIPCINQEIGCEALMMRSDLVQHLSKCPANVLPCHLSADPSEPPSQSEAETAPAKDGDMVLSDLPTELLMLVFGFLDPWTLSNISLVSTKCRDAVAGLVKKRGCVSLQWERVEIVGKDGKPRQSWQVTGKKWFFSSTIRGVYGTCLTGVLPTPGRNHVPVTGRVL